MTPTPPFLFIRPKLAYWPKSEWHNPVSATLQAVREGCFENTRCLDSAGLSWPIVSAAPPMSITFLDEHLPWRQVPVTLTLGAPVAALLHEQVEALCEILSHPETDFPFELEAPPNAIQDMLRNAKSVPDLISVAAKCFPGAT